MASQSQRQMGKMIGVSGTMVNYHINKSLKLKVRKKLQVHRMTKVNIEKRKKCSWGLYRALNNKKWMPKSPDEMKQQLWGTNANNVAALKRAVKRAWKDMSQELVNKALASWPKRC
ncbi:hypothetical protein ILUMI_21112 [Ignelater luminosus]|uniref:Uncharacterized protein n=1 Tax=Ignelater luminosus TaxID=2038154 RepID=A0A8K0G1Q1_IGNLU|nr:hypothetical protein ILUMI_21112 [Ignelater luminosus]